MRGNIVCQDCGVQAPRRGPTQRYCEPCSAARDRRRKLEWAKRHAPNPHVTRRARERKLSRAKATGQAISRAVAETIAWPASDQPNLRWLVRVAVPFDYGYSKNAVWRLSDRGHVYMRRQARSLRDALAWELKQALSGVDVFEGKVWIDIFVQKPDHRGDAVNVVDTVCDAIKLAIPVDDNWYCLRRLDWQVTKSNPRLFVGVGQEVAEHHRVCSHCGRLLTLEQFGKKSSARLGRDRICRDCRRGKPLEDVAA